jgi:glycosyltransferase involved in cell wall biosynthesis
VNRVIKILHTEWSNGWGGQEIRILAESQNFIKKGYEVIIAAQPNSELYKKSNQAGVRTIAINMNKGINFVAIWNLVRYIKKNKIDIIHTHSSVDSRTAGIAGKIAGIKIVRSRHISLPISKSRLTWWQYMKLADKVITSGRDIRNNMIRDNKMLPNKIASAPAGVDTKIFSEKRDLKDIRPKYNIEKTDFLVGIVSVLRSWKGHSYLIEAIKMVSNEISNIHLIIVGEGPQKENIEQLVESLEIKEKVTLTGYQPNPEIFFKAMDVMVLPSFAGEATSQVLPQAMLMGKPVISTEAGGLSEVVIHNETGLIVPTKDSYKIYKAIKKLHNDKDLRNKLIKNGKKHALKNFTFDQMINTTENVYQEVLGL